MRLSFVAITLLATTAAVAQNAPAVDNVTIAPYTGGGASLTIQGDTLHGTDISLATLLYKAYGIPPTAIFGLTREQAAARFNINARIAAANAGQPGSPDARRYMLQTLLANHFGVKVHTESRDLPVYQLVADDSGIKLHPVASEKNLGFTADDTRLTGHAFSMSDLALNASDKMGAIIINKTGLDGRYDVDFHWPHGVHAQIEGLGEDTLRTGTSLDNYQLGFVTAIQQQLGLKMVPATAPIKTLIVDYLELPAH